MNKVRIVFADPEQNNLNAFQANFRRIEEYELLTCLSAEQLRIIIKNVCVNVLILDQRILEVLGNNFLHIHKNNGVTCIVVTTYREVSDLEKAHKDKLLHCYFTKPYNTEDLHLSIKEALEKK